MTENDTSTPPARRLVLPRLSLKEKRLIFLKAVASMPEYTKGIRIPLCWTSMPQEVWDTFRSEWLARKFVRRMECLGLIRIENDDFCYLTEAGRVAMTPKGACIDCGDGIMAGARSFRSNCREVRCFACRVKHANAAGQQNAEAEQP